MKSDSLSSRRRVPGALDVLLAAAAGFSLAGLVVGHLTLRLAPQVQGDLGSSVYLLAFFTALYAASGLVLGAAAALPLTAARLLPVPAGLRGVLGMAGAAGLGLGPLLYALLLPDLGLAGEVLADVFFGTPGRRLAALVLAAALLVSAGYGLRALLARRTRPRALVAAAWLVAVVGICSGSLATRSVAATRAPVRAAAMPELPPAAARPAPVVLLCIDGADLDDMVLPMARRGELPAFSRLMEEGTWGALESFPPGRSHVIWTTIITGKAPEEHGIRNFTTFRVPGLAATVDELPLHTGLNRLLPKLADRFPSLPQLHAPYTSAMRDVEALWNIAGHYYPVGVYQWLVTWPAEEVDGFYVAGGMRWAQFVTGFREDAERGLPEGSVHPPDALAGLDLPARPRLGAADFAPYLKAGAALPAANDPRLRMLDEAIGDPTAEVVAQLVGKYAPLFTAVDFYNVDSHQHLFTKDMNAGGPFASAVPAAYRLADAKLAELMAALGDGYNYLVISDHGYDFARDHHIEAPPGVFFACGPAFTPGRRLDALSVYDVAPLVLRLLGLPVAEDMPAAREGRYARALAPAFAAARPEVRVATYETGRQRARSTAASPLDAEITDVLRSLGYIE